MNERNIRGADKFYAFLKSRNTQIISCSCKTVSWCSYLNEIEEGELFKDKNTNHILQYVPDVGLVHNELFCKEITGCINFQKNN